MCMCMCVYVCVCVCMYVCACVCVCPYMCLCVATVNRFLENLLAPGPVHPAVLMETMQATDGEANTN